jgi:hypothetical protein
MPRKRRSTATHGRDLTYEEAFPGLPTELLELIYAAKDAAGMEYHRVPSPDEWEAMGKQGTAPLPREAGPGAASADPRGRAPHRARTPRAREEAGRGRR